MYGCFEQNAFYESSGFSNKREQQFEEWRCKLRQQNYQRRWQFISETGSNGKSSFFLSTSKSSSLHWICFTLSFHTRNQSCFSYYEVSMYLRNCFLLLRLNCLYKEEVKIKLKLQERSIRWSLGWCGVVFQLP